MRSFGGRSLSFSPRVCGTVRIRVVPSRRRQVESIDAFPGGARLVLHVRAPQAEGVRDEARAREDVVRARLVRGLRAPLGVESAVHGREVGR